jgi:predicted glycogen debranching enzyme
MKSGPETELTERTAARGGSVGVELVRRLPWGGNREADLLLTREWLITNGLGGYSAGTLGGAVTRRYHGLLIAALPAPLGRVVMLSQIAEQLRLPGRRAASLRGEHRVGAAPELHGAEHLREFRLESGLPVWEFAFDGLQLQKRLLMPHEQNTVHLSYTLAAGRGPVRLDLRPLVHFRYHDAPVGALPETPYRVSIVEARFEISVEGPLPPLRLRMRAADSTFLARPERTSELMYRLEEMRGYQHSGELWSPGFFRVELDEGQTATLVASTEPWEIIDAIPPGEGLAAERERRVRLLAQAHPEARHGPAAELVLAADQFIIRPGRVRDAVRARSAGDEERTIVAGYHWFTDWGRDTMISLEGLALATGRAREAGYILRTFAHYVRDGLIPNMFPDGEREGLYHTADATLWFFHAIDRYVEATGDHRTLSHLLPLLREIIDAHVAGTRFGIGVDPADGLLRQGAEGYQLTWMDAKVEGWVVTPRRGKAVEINALWYNALRLMEGWLVQNGEVPAGRDLGGMADRAGEAFNGRFWFDAGGYLYDVVDCDGEPGRTDDACRPNQVLAISLRHPVLAPGRWARVLEVVRERLLTPVGLRSLAPGHPEYRRTYRGDLRARDAAYHQGTVWGWLIGPYVDAWLKVHPGEHAAAARWLEGFTGHLDEACIGSISEIFDAEPPFTPRGCVSQAWSVAEVLRCWIKVRERPTTIADNAATPSGPG